jgi:hypothetical protein
MKPIPNPVEEPDPIDENVDTPPPPSDVNPGSADTPGTE